ncbi:MAG: hypothetical protein WAP03_12805 [Methylorubrum rhodinum]|uniref:hypothetical protein n=1 Tax=Methylorubrum rhodinum TaxID=29428 RepID=UPI003BB20426
MPAETSFNYLQLISTAAQVSGLIVTAKIAQFTYKIARKGKRVDLALRYHDIWNSQDMLASREKYKALIAKKTPWIHIHDDDMKKSILPLLNFLLELTRFLQRPDLIDRATIRSTCPEMAHFARDLFDPNILWAKDCKNASFKTISVLPAYISEKQIPVIGSRYLPDGKFGIIIGLSPLRVKLGRSAIREWELKSEFLQRRIIVEAYFDKDYYLNENSDVRNAGIDPYLHFMKFGWHERRNPSRAFDTAEYLQAYRDVFNAGINPLEHYAIQGKIEGFWPQEVMQPHQPRKRGKQR